MQQRRPVMLVVLDGCGWREEEADNAVRLARTPTLRPPVVELPARLAAHLGRGRRPAARPDGQFGGRPPQHRRRPRRQADAAAHHRRDRGPRDRPGAGACADLIERLRQSRGTCHLMGLVSPGGVHSHQDHAAALARLLADAGIPTVVHAFTDGRDTPPRSAGDDIKRLAAALPPAVKIATVSGRYYAMDRDKRWERVSQGLSGDRRGRCAALRRPPRP